MYLHANLYTPTSRNLNDRLARAYIIECTATKQCASYNIICYDGDFDVSRQWTPAISHIIIIYANILLCKYWQFRGKNTQLAAITAEGCAPHRYNIVIADDKTDISFVSSRLSGAVSGATGRGGGGDLDVRTPTYICVFKYYKWLKNRVFFLM